jgi:Domain of unknown function (DUF5703)
MAMPLAAQTVSSGNSAMLDVDFRNLVSRGDLIYDRPAARSEEGLPVGNGRMGSLVWTTPGEMRLQINRNDVYANNCASNSFFERHNDYCGGCGYVDIDFGAAPEEPFPDSGFEQRLSIYDGVLQIKGKNVDVRVLAWPEQDVMAIAVDDRLARRELAIRLRMLRYETKYFGAQLETFAKDHIVTVQTLNHTAASQLLVSDGRIALTQDFREGSYCCKSAVAIGIVGRTAKARFLNETETGLEAASGSGEFTILIASAATFDPAEDVAAAALRQLDAARSAGLAALERQTREWWHNFWARGFVHISGDGGDAQLVEQNYHCFLYLMAATSRGKFPTKFNGMLWNTGGDLRTWGAQHWFANLSCYYEALPASNRLDLMDPMFDMYSGMFDACSTAARQQWGSQGMYIPETSYFDGLEKLPGDIAAEMSQLYLMKKPWEQRSARFMEFAQTKHPHSSRWNWMQSGSYVNGRWVIVERGSGPYGNVSHIMGSTAKIAYLYWRRYEYTLDREWLARRAYPMLKAAVEFYRNFPNSSKGADGKYHIHWVNSNESVWGATDTDEDLSSMRGITGALLRAAAILDADAVMRPVWREFLDNLAPLPTSDNPEALRTADYAGPRVFVRGLKPAVKASGLLPDGNSLPMWFFDLCNVESSDRQTLETAHATFAASLRNELNPQIVVQTLSKQAIAAASLGRADAVRVMIPSQIRGSAERTTAYKGGGALSNRMMLREGPQALDAERLGRESEALHLALLQSNPPAPGEDGVIHVFPAWPKEWNAQYKLLARGAFVVSASIEAGRIGFVELESLAGAECKLRNPFGGGVALFRDGRAAESLQGTLLHFATRKGERIVIVAAGRTPADERRKI